MRVVKEIRTAGVPIESLAISRYTVPTTSPESDGTISWTSTTMILVEAFAGGEAGIGYTYADASAAVIIRNLLEPKILNMDAMSVPECWIEMVRAIRNQGRPGICSMAIAAVDTALWDLKARILGVPLCDLLGRVRDSVPLYGSGGFTSYSIPDLQKQLSGWISQGIPRVKMKIGTHPVKDFERVKAAREAIGEEAELFVDANGAYSRKQALSQAEKFADLGVKWFEEPVSSDDLEGLRLIRDRAPAIMDIAAGEYGYDAHYFRRMLDAGAVDVLQADASRCAGYTGFLQADALCLSRSMPLSAHTSPALHVPVCCAAQRLRHLEYFYDHVRIEEMLFDGLPQLVNGELCPDLSRPGSGLQFKIADARRYAA
jgi:L-alanine-DL-glutamate epimerase-like enolase superfamily enzyme